MTDPNDVKKDACTLPSAQTVSLTPEELRRHAEETVRRKALLMPEALSPEETRQMLHELHVHQIELEMQNEELRRAQEELDAVRTRYFDLYDLAPAGYFTISKNGLILEANLTAANLLGVTRGELAGQPFTRFMTREDHDFYYLHRKKLLTTSESLEVDLRMIKNDGTTFWIRLKSAIAQNDDGAQVFRAIMSDITERKQTEEALNRSEAHFKLLSETARQLIAWKNVEAVISELCRKTMEHLGCDTFFIYLINSKTGKFHLTAHAGISNERAREMEWVGLGESIPYCEVLGAESIVRENISNSSDPRTTAARALGIQAYACFPLVAQDMHIGTVSFGTKTRTTFSREDLTLIKTVTAHMATAMQRTILVEKIQEAHDSLETIVNERTSDLRRMIRALKQSNIALEDFAHVASHDLQEPLRKIMTFADRLISTGKNSLNDTERDYLARMQYAAERMRSLVSELVKYSLITSDRDALKIINLKRPVEDAIKDIGVLLEESEGHIEIGELPNIEANETQMRQLFMNLIGNALKYRSEQKPSIRIYSNSSTDNFFHEIHIQDNGIGFEEIYLDKIFKPFQRLHGRTSPYQGTGMGLAICRKIIEHHGGSITAKSEPGKGSTFIVRLPKPGLREVKDKG